MPVPSVPPVVPPVAVPFPAGACVIVSDGMASGAAVVLSGPYPRLTTDCPLYVIRFEEDGEIFLADARDMCPVD